MRSRKFHCLAGVAWLGTATAAAAEPALPLELAACPAALSPMLSHALSVELRALRDERPSLASPQLERVRVECYGGNAARVSVNLREQEPLSVTLEPLAPELPARARALALAAAELIDVLWTAEVARSNPTPSEPTPSEPSPARVVPRQAMKPSIRERERPFRLGLALSVERTGRPAALLLGPNVALEMRATLRFRLRLDLNLNLDLNLSPAMQRLEVDGDAASLRVLSFSSSVHALYVRAVGAWDWALGPGVRLGYVELRGLPQASGWRGARFGAPWLGFGALSSLNYAFSELLGAAFALDAGWVSSPVVATSQDGAELFALTRLWVGGRLGLALKF